MNAPLDITGRRYGRLVAIERAPNRGRRTVWACRCDCGNSVIVRLENLQTGTALSCGCFRAETTRKRSLTHGHRVGRSTSRTLKSYQHAKGRCFNPSDPKYPIYGGRGITMCSEWKDDFSAFLRDMGEAPAGTSLDRIDVHGNYEPGNCRWATTSQQARTRTDNVIVEHEGQRMILKDFATLLGVNYKLLHAKVRYHGMTPHEAATRLVQAQALRRQDQEQNHPATGQ